MWGPSISTTDCQSERCFTEKGLERSAISQRNSSFGFWKSIVEKLKIFEIFTRHSRSMARTQSNTPSPTSNHLFVEALLKLAATSDEFQDLVQAMANKTTTPEQLMASLTEYVSSTAKDVTDSPAPLEESQGMVKKQHVKELLDPNLSLTADSLRDFFLPRNNAFAREIVNAIARKLSCTPPAVNCDGAGYRFDKYGNMPWDNLIGYRAYEAFETNQERYIANLARTDLKKRGFLVHDLRLFQEKQRCGQSAVSCRCQNHGIYVSWKIGYKELNDDSGGLYDNDYDYDNY